MERADINIFLLLPAAAVFVLLVLHCYLYRGRRLTFIFFVSILILSFFRQVSFDFIYKSAGKSPYLILKTTSRIFHFCSVEYIGWAITFYLSWYLAERILKRLGYLYDRIFPTIVWSILVSGAISYCVETTAIRAGWWLWMFFDPRFKDFLVAPFSALQGWSTETAIFLSIFFLSECSKYRKQWWRVFLYTAILGVIIDTVIYSIILLSPRNYNIFRNINKFFIVFDSARILLPIILMFLWPITFKYEHLDMKNLKRHLSLYDATPLLSLLFILSICIGIDIIALNEPVFLFSTLPLIFLLMFSIRKIPITLIFFMTLILLLIGNKFAYIISIPTAIFFAFWAFESLRERYKLKLMRY